MQQRARGGFERWVQCQAAWTWTVFGSKGSSRVNAYEIKKKKVYEEKREKEVSPYVQEHIDLIKSIRAGKPLNELRAVTESTATAIMGRNACSPGTVSSSL